MSEVILLNYTPDTEITIAKSARLCYFDKNIDELDNLTKDDIKKLINKLFDNNHLSPFEHSIFTFGIKCSRACSHQLVRHRIASFNQKSQRYVSENEFEYYIPESIRKSKYIDNYLNIMRNINNLYNNMKNIPKEDKRYILPNACKTQVILTMNIRSLINFFNLRTCEKSQNEIKNISYKMLYILRKKSPNIFNKVGPSCFMYKSCSEKNNSCGKNKEICEIFSNNKLFCNIINRNEV